MPISYILHPVLPRSQFVYSFVLLDFCSSVIRHIPLDSLDPSLAIGFYCRNKGLTALSWAFLAHRSLPVTMPFLFLISNCSPSGCRWFRWLLFSRIQAGRWIQWRSTVHGGSDPRNTEARWPRWWFDWGQHCRRERFVFRDSHGRWWRVSRRRRVATSLRQWWSVGKAGQALCSTQSDMNR